jgi:hypothetical protein
MGGDVCSDGVAVSLLIPRHGRVGVGMTGFIVGTGSGIHMR